MYPGQACHLQFLLKSQSAPPVTPSHRPMSPSSSPSQTFGVLPWYQRAVRLPRRGYTNSSACALWESAGRGSTIRRAAVSARTLWEATPALRCPLGSKHMKWREEAKDVQRGTRDAENMAPPPRAESNGLRLSPNESRHVRQRTRQHK